MSRFKIGDESRFVLSEPPETIPPDDSEPITTDWLLTAGMTRPEPDGKFSGADASMWPEYKLRWYENGKSMCLDGESLPGCKTRGDFRTLLRFLKGGSERSLQ